VLILTTRGVAGRRYVLLHLLLRGGLVGLSIGQLRCKGETDNSTIIVSRNSSRNLPMLKILGI